MRIEEPLNTEERYLHGINVRLNILIEMFSSFLDVYAKEEEVATSENTEEIFVEVEEELPFEEFDYIVFTKAEIMSELDILGIEYNKSALKSELIDLIEQNI